MLADIEGRCLFFLGTPDNQVEKIATNKQKQLKGNLQSEAKPSCWVFILLQGFLSKSDKWPTCNIANGKIIRCFWCFFFNVLKPCYVALVDTLLACACAARGRLEGLWRSQEGGLPSLQNGCLDEVLAGSPTPSLDFHSSWVVKASPLAI